jgi:hypothetical protein
MSSIDLKTDAEIECDGPSVILGLLRHSVINELGLCWNIADSTGNCHGDNGTAHGSCMYLAAILYISGVMNLARVAMAVVSCNAQRAHSEVPISFRTVYIPI